MLIDVWIDWSFQKCIIITVYFLSLFFISKFIWKWLLEYQFDAFVEFDFRIDTIDSQIDTIDSTTAVLVVLNLVDVY